MLKEQYKGRGMTVARTVEETKWGISQGIYIRGTWWEIWLELEHMTKGAKAALIELIGDMPEAGIPFCAKIEGNQYEIDTLDYDLLERAKRAKIKFKTTEITREHIGERRILQNIETGKIIEIKEIIMKLIDEGEMEQDESNPAGPVAASEDGNMLYWWNGVCCLGVCRTMWPDEGTEQYRFLKHLEKIDVI